MKRSQLDQLPYVKDRPALRRLDAILAQAEESLLQPTNKSVSIDLSLVFQSAIKRRRMTRARCASAPVRLSRFKFATKTVPDAPQSMMVPENSTSFGQKIFELVAHGLKREK